MRILKNVIFFLFIILASACKKDKEYCWQVYDAMGVPFTIVCDKTEAEMNEQYGSLFDRQDAPKFCWKVQMGSGSFNYIENLSEKMVNIYFYGSPSIQKVNCGFCQRWISREKGLYKPTGSFAYKPAKLEQYCGDTCATLFVGRIITLRDTPDSLITVEFIQKQ